MRWLATYHSKLRNRGKNEGIRFGLEDLEHIWEQSLLR